MSELRRDPIIGRWVIVETPERSQPPEAYDKEAHVRKHAAICQFCSGREDQTPFEVDAVRPYGSPANSPGWSARVIPNKFPALRIEGELNRRGVGMYDMTNGVGAHEVVIETNDHNKDLSDLSIDEVTGIVRLYQNRAVSLARDKRFKYILIFKNFGESAGASIEHAHSQIIALPMVPKYVLEELEGAQNYFKFRGRCVFCDMIQQEYADRERIITENELFIALCPFAPRYPFETWIFPKNHPAGFYSMDQTEQVQLAGILKEMLTRMKVALSNPSYNYYLHVEPVNYGEQESFHWHIEIVPQLTREAGYEWGTGFYMVRTSPSVAAGHLRAAVIR